MTLSHENLVPTLWVGCDSEDVFTLDVIVLLVAVAFGTVHCIGWFYAFPSDIEQAVWCNSVVTIVAVTMLLAFLAAFSIANFEFIRDVGENYSGPSFTICAIFYIAPPLMLIVLPAMLLVATMSARQFRLTDHRQVCDS